MRVEIQAYLDGLEARELGKNPRIRQLADLLVGESFTRVWGPDQPMVKYLQSQDKRRARILMENPGADWKSTPVDFGVRITRIA